MKPLVFIDLPCNPLSVNVVNDGGGNGNGLSDGGRFLTAKRDNRLALMGYWYSCCPVGFRYVTLSLQVDQNSNFKTVFKMLIKLAW